MSPPLSPTMRSRIIELREQGMTMQAIAKAVGKSKNAVVGICRRAGLCEPRPAPPTVPRLEFPERGSCLWIHGDPKSPDARFCAAPATPDAPWCAEHRARAWVKPS